MTQSGVKMREMRVNFQLMTSMVPSRQTMVLGSLTRSERPHAQEVVERGRHRPRCGAMSSLVVVFLEEIERKGADLAKGRPLFDIVGDAQAAPGEKIAAAVTEGATQDNGERDKQKNRRGIASSPMGRPLSGSQGSITRKNSSLSVAPLTLSDWIIAFFGARWPFLGP